MKNEEFEEACHRASSVVDRIALGYLYEDEEQERMLVELYDRLGWPSPSQFILVSELTSEEFDPYREEIEELMEERTGEIPLRVYRIWLSIDTDLLSWYRAFDAATLARKDDAGKFMIFSESNLLILQEYALDRICDLARPIRC